VDETGHSGDTGSADSGSGGDSHDRSLLNGWAMPNSPWSNAGAALEPDDEDVPAWRRPATEIRPFTRQPLPPEQPPGEIRPFGEPERPSSRFDDRGRFDNRANFDDSRQPHLEERGQPGPAQPSPAQSGPGDATTSGDVRPFGDIGRSGEARPPSAPRAEGPGTAWSSGRARYSDLLAHLSPNGNQPSPSIAPPPPSFQPGPVPTGPAQAASAPPEPEPPIPPRPDPFGPELLRPDPLRSEPQRPDSLRPDSRSDSSLPDSQLPGAPTRRSPLFPQRPDSLQADDQRRTSELRAIDSPPPSSAPPYPYEGDLDDAARREPPAQQRAAVPLSRPFPAVRPATPGGRRVDWTSTESARHALEPPTPADGLPRVDPAAAEENRSSGEASPARPSYDPSSFPRRLPYEPTPPAGSAPSVDSASGYAPPTAYAGLPGRPAGDPGFGPSEQTSRALPKRVPAEPDVPTVPEPPAVEPPAETPALARIATHLRRGDVLSAQERQEGFDVKAILEAVKEVDGVRDASLRSTPAGAHSLRLDLAEGADPAEVSRQVARLLQDRMGLDAAMPGGLDAALKGERPKAYGPAREAPAAHTPVSGGPAGATPASATPAAAPPGLRPISPAPAAGATTSAGTPRSASAAGAAPAAGGAAPAEFARSLPQNPQAGRSAAGLGSVTERPAVNGPTRPDLSTPNPATTMETLPSAQDWPPPRPLEIGERPGPRVVIENVQVNTFGTEATVEVRLAVGPRTASGVATGPAVDGYLLRLCAMATGHAVDELLSTSDHVDGPARCFVEHASAVPFGSMRVAVVVLLLSCGGWVEQLAGSAVVTGDDRHAMVRATLAAVNRRLEALLS
jgi:hypothetical protein